MRINKSLITLASGGSASTVPWSGVTGTPTTLSGYGITDAVPSSRTLTINGVSYDLSANRTWTVGSVTSVALATGTTGTDVNVSGSPITGSGTITLNIPDASAFNRGLITTSTQTIAGVKTFSGNRTNINGLLDLGNYIQMQELTLASGSPSSGKGYIWLNSATSTLYFRNDLNVDYDLTANSGGTVTSVALATGTTGTDVNVSGSPITSSGTITLNIPDASATNRGLVTINDQTFLGTKTFRSGIITTSDAGGTRGIIVDGNTTANIAGYVAIKSGVSGWTAQSTGYVGISSSQSDYLTLFFQGTTKAANLIGSSLTTARNYTLPDASGTIALTSSLTGYVPTTTTLTINDTAFDLSANRSWDIGDYGTW